jgi:hypothetical protein
MAAVGTIISNEDYNAIRNKIIPIMGTGVSTSGYGQTTLSTSVASSQQITKVQWDNLRFDIVNALVHQTGALPSITEVQTTDAIRYGANFPNFQYNTLAEQAVSNKFNLGDGQFAIASKTSQTRISSWSSSVSCTLTVSFGTVDQARFFFNSGSKIRFRSSRTGGSSTSQNTSWSNLLDSVGNFDFGGNVPSLNFYSLTSSDQTIYNSVASSPYASNTYRIQARCNVSDNSAGTANIVYFTITWLDPYVDPGTPAPGDSVDGTLSLIIEEVKAEGSLLPPGTGSFSITSPTYSISSITGS